MTDRSVVYRLRADVTQFRAQMAAAGLSVKGAAAEMTAANRSGTQFRAGLSTLGNTAGKVGLVAAAGLGAAVITAANFDESMSKVEAATHETADAMERLRAAALKAGADTKFSASEAAEGEEALAKAGVKTADILSGGLNGALSLAAAGNQSVGDAAETAASAMTQFKLAGKDIPHIADLLAAGAGKAQGEVSDLAQALNQVGLVSAQTGLSIEETTGGLAAFASAGLIGSDAGTSFKTMLLRLTPTSTKAATMMEALGISAFDSQGQFIGLAKYAGVLQKALKDKTDEERQSILQTVFGQDAIRAANVLYQQGAKGINKWTDAVDDQGFAAETAGIKMDNLRGDLEQLRGSLETALIGAGEGSQGPLRKVVQSLTDVVNAYSRMPESGKSAVSAVLGVTAAAGAGIFIFSKVVQGIANTRLALDQMGVSAGRSSGRLVRIGASAGTILVAAQAMGALANATLDLGRAVNSSDIPRDLERIAGGGDVDSLNDLAGALKGVNEAGAGTVNALFSIPSAITGIKTSFATDTDTIEQFDQSLASLVESGNAEQAAAAFQAIKDAASDQGVSASEVTSRFDAYKTALDNSAASAEGAATSTDDAAKAQERMVGHLKKAKQALDDETKAARENAAQFIDISTNVDKAKVSLSDWIKQMVKQTEALKNFRLNAQEAAKKGLDQGLIHSLEEMGPKGALRMKQLSDATKEEIDKANRAWREGQRQIELFGDTLGGLKPPKPISVDVNIAGAMRKITTFQLALNGIHGRDIDITARTTGGRVLAGNADGGTIPKTGLGYADRHLRLLADGEEVISNRFGQADRNRALLKAINAGHMANGGTVGAASSAPALGVSIDYDRLTRSLLAARPMYGDVHVNGDPTSFRQQTQQDAAMAALSGVGRG